MFKPDNIENEFFLKLGFSFSPEELAKGKILISEPFLGDPNFSRSVILLLEYSKENGAVGFVLNKPTDLNMSDMIEEYPIDSFRYHYGGPVKPENVFFLHTLGDSIDHSQQIIPGLWWGGDFDQITSLIKSGTVPQREVKFFGGYSGWAAQQLEDELLERSWILSSMSTEQIMKEDIDELWRESLKSLGKKFSIIADFPEDPALN
jgi:putative transcriptional regulator